MNIDKSSKSTRKVVLRLAALNASAIYRRLKRYNLRGAVSAVNSREMM